MTDVTENLTMLAVGTLFAVLGLLTGRPRAVRSGDVLFFLGLGLHLARIRVAALAAPTERDAVLQDFLKVLLACPSLLFLLLPSLGEGLGVGF